MKNQIKKIGALVLALSLAVTLVPVNYASAAAKQPAIAKSATVKVGAKKTLSIKSNGWTVKKVTVKSSAKTVVAAKASGKKAVVVTGKSAGKATVTTTIKAVKGKTTKTFKLTTSVKVKSDPVPSANEKATVTSQEELDAALANSALKEITISGDVTSLTIAKGSYADVALIVNAPKATITNEGTFKSVEIQAIAPDTWKEKAVGNIFTVIAKVAHIVAQQGASIANITVAATGSKESGNVVKIEAESGATVNKVSVDSAAVKVEATSNASDANIGTIAVSASGADISVSGSQSTAVKVEVAASASQTKVEASTKVDVANAAAGTSVDLKSGAAGSTVQATTASATVETKNETGSDVKVTDNSGKDTTVSNGQTTTTTSQGTTGDSSTGGSGQSGEGSSSAGGSGTGGNFSVDPSTVPGDPIELSTAISEGTTTLTGGIYAVSTPTTISSDFTIDDGVTLTVSSTLTVASGAKFINNGTVKSGTSKVGVLAGSGSFDGTGTYDKALTLDGPTVTTSNADIFSKARHASATSVNKVVLSGDVTLSSASYGIKKAVEIDLNGHTLNCGEGRLQVMKDGALTVSSTTAGGKITGSDGWATITLINEYEDATAPVLTIGSGVTIENTSTVTPAFDNTKHNTIPDLGSAVSVYRNGEKSTEKYSITIDAAAKLVSANAQISFMSTLLYTTSDQLSGASSSADIGTWAKWNSSTFTDGRTGGTFTKAFFAGDANGSGDADDTNSFTVAYYSATNPS